MKKEKIDIKRRKFINSMFSGSIAVIGSYIAFSKKSDAFDPVSFTNVRKLDNITSNNINGNNQMFKLIDLPYDFSALEPYIDAKTVELHYSKHNKSYIDNLNKFIIGTHDEDEKDIKKIITNNKNLKDESEIRIFNNAGQAYNHDLYWRSMKPNGGGSPDKDSVLFAKMKEMVDFSNHDDVITKVNEELIKVSVSQFGSGWGWLVYNKDTKKLEIIKTSNGDNPVTKGNLVPLLGIDVWEHAYYLTYQNRRQEYIEKFLSNLVNWKFAEENLLNALNN